MTDKVKAPASEGTVMKTDAIVAGSPYSQLLADTHVLIKQFYGKTLEFYWQLGKRVEDLTASTDKYGQRTLETFSEDLERVEHIKLGVDSLYDAQKVAKCFTKAQIEQAKEAKLSLRRMLPMCTKNVTPEMRSAILEEAKNHTGPEAFKVDDAVSSKLGTATGGSGSGETPDSKNAEGSDEAILKKALKRAKGAEKMVAMLENKLKDIGDCFAHVCSESDEDAIVQVNTYYEEFSIALDSFNDTMTSQKAKATKALTKVSEVLKKKK